MDVPDPVSPNATVAMAAVRGRGLLVAERALTCTDAREATREATDEVSDRVGPKPSPGQRSPGIGHAGSSDARLVATFPQVTTRVVPVGDTGFEPVTSSVSRKRATTAPIALGV